MPYGSVAVACGAFVFELQEVYDLLWLWIGDFFKNVVFYAGGLAEGCAAVVAYAFLFWSFSDID